MEKGSRYAFQFGILLVCAWACKPIITLEAEAIPAQAAEVQAQTAQVARTVQRAVVPLDADWPGTKRQTRGPVDPFTYRPSPEETPVYGIVQMLLEGAQPTSNLASAGGARRPISSAGHASGAERISMD